MPFMTITLTGSDGTPLWRRDATCRSTSDSEKQAASAYTYIRSRKHEISDMLDQVVSIRRVPDQMRWTVHATTGDLGGALGHIAVEFSDKPATQKRPLPITVEAETQPGKADPNAEGRFANIDRAMQYARMLAATDGYTVGGVWLTGRNGIRLRIGA